MPDATLDFYFDFSSPYGYLGSRRIEDIAARHGRGIEWHPILLGAIFKVTGSAPLSSIPLKSEYAKRDFARSARFHGVPEFSQPSRFPIASQAPARIVVWLKQGDPAQVAPAIHALYRAYFQEDRDISAPDMAADAVGRIGIDPGAARAAIDDPAIKDALRQEVDWAIAKGVFGSPFVIVDGEPFWGIDRFDQLERWLASGGF